jgi:hypothetical protein
VKSTNGRRSRIRLQAPSRCVALIIAVVWGLSLANGVRASAVTFFGPDGGYLLEACGDGVDNNGNGFVDENCPPILIPITWGWGLAPRAG